MTPKGNAASPEHALRRSASNDRPRPPVRVSADETLDIGEDTAPGTPIIRDDQVPLGFTGEFEKLVIDLNPRRRLRRPRSGGGPIEPPIIDISRSSSRTSITAQEGRESSTGVQHLDCSRDQALR
jgi:hypothetical protein